MSRPSFSHPPPEIPPNPAIIAVGLNHHAAPVEIRELLSWNRQQQPALLHELQRAGIPGVALSTCNRSEFYFLETAHADGCARLKNLLSRRFSISPDDLERYLYTHKDHAAALHLFRLASGLDSMILGEDQIIGQVRQAYQAASAAGTAPGLLARLFQQALRAGRMIRRESGIGRNALSVSRACVDLARCAVGDLSNRAVLVAGAGEAGQTAAEALSQAGARNITVTNRTHARAAELAARLSAQAVTFDQMPQALQTADIVIACTGSPGYVLSAKLIAAAMSARPHRPLFLMDIAVPRDIDPQAAALPNVSLSDLDHLETIAQAGRQAQTQQATIAEALAAEEALRFDQWRRQQDSLPPVIELRRQADQIRRRELKRALKRLNPKLTQEEQASLDAMTKSIVNKLLHSPTVYLKNRPSPAAHQTAQEIFGQSHPQTRKTRKAP